MTKSTGRRPLCLCAASRRCSHPMTALKAKKVTSNKNAYKLWHLMALRLTSKEKTLKFWPIGGISLFLRLSVMKFPKFQDRHGKISKREKKNLHKKVAIPPSINFVRDGCELVHQLWLVGLIWKPLRVLSTGRVKIVVITRVGHDSGPTKIDKESYVQWVISYFMKKLENFGI